MTEKLTLLGIFAHPDDEAFGTGGTLTKYAAEGVDVHLITATRGDAGQIATGVAATTETLGQVREQELRNACQVYGINPPHLLNYPDGQLTIINQQEAVCQIVGLIRTLQPQVVISFGPDGVYGHYDHIACHRWATIAVRLAAEPAWFPEQLLAGLKPHTISKFYHRATSQSLLADLQANGRRDVMMDGVPFPFVAYPDEEITTWIDIRPYATQKRQAILAHASQIGDPTQFADQPSLYTQTWFQVETYIRAQCEISITDKVETDLFAGLR